jgi:hypothetical protein
MAEQHLVFGESEIGRSTSNPLWFIGGNNSLPDGFQKFFERGTMRMFGRVALREIPFYFVEIDGERGHARRLEKPGGAVNFPTAANGVIHD